MLRDVENFIRKYESCAKMKGGKTPFAPLGQLPGTAGPMEVASIDICGPYLITRKGTVTCLHIFASSPGTRKRFRAQIKKRKLLLQPLWQKCSRDTVDHGYFHLLGGQTLCPTYFRKCANYFRLSAFKLPPWIPRCKAKLKNFMHVWIRFWALCE
jgi:hypothetical protein